MGVSSLSGFHVSTESIVSTASSLGPVKGPRPLVHGLRKRLWEFEKYNTSKSNDTLRETTKAFRRYLERNIHFLDEESEYKKVDVIYAYPERAIAQFNRDKNLRLPIVSVGLESIDHNEERLRYTPMVSFSTVWDEKERRAIRIAQFLPKQVEIYYSLNIWTKYQEDLNQILEAVELEFQPHLELSTKYADNVKFFIDNREDLTDVVVQSGEQRILRFAFTIKCETYIPHKSYRVTNTGQIEEWHTEFIVTKHETNSLGVVNDSQAPGGGVESDGDPTEIFTFLALDVDLQGAPEPDPRDRMLLETGDQLIVE